LMMKMEDGRINKSTHGQRDWPKDLENITDFANITNWWQEWQHIWRKVYKIMHAKLRSDNDICDTVLTATWWQNIC
jgi:hypothetical protein